MYDDETTTESDVKAAASDVMAAKTIEQLKNRLLDFGRVYAAYEYDGGTLPDEYFLDMHQIPQFNTDSKPTEPYHLSVPWYSRDDEKVLVVLSYNEHDMYFVDYDGNRV